MTHHTCAASIQPFRARWSPRDVKVADASEDNGLLTITAAVCGHLASTSIGSGTGWIGCWNPALIGGAVLGINGAADSVLFRDDGLREFVVSSPRGFEGCNAWTTICDISYYQ